MATRIPREIRLQDGSYTYVYEDVGGEIVEWKPLKTTYRPPINDSDAQRLRRRTEEVANRIRREAERNQLETELANDDAYQQYLKEKELAYNTQSAASRPRGGGNFSDKALQGAIVNLFAQGVELNVKETIKEAADEAVLEVAGILEALKKEIKEHKHVTVTTERGTKTIKGLHHERFETLLKLCSMGSPIMMVGPAGTGKTFAAERCAEALDLNFYMQSVGSQTSKSDLLGFVHANGGYVRSQFREAYENGGVFLMDEVDAGNPNVLVVLNSALAGTLCAFPDAMIQRHTDFICLAAANTYGTGASRTYVGRNQLDAATLDRFVILDWPIDTKLELALVQHFKFGEAWFRSVLAVRKMVEDRSIRIIISPRATLKGAQLLESGFALPTVIEMTLLATANVDDRQPIADMATAIFNKK